MEEKSGQSENDKTVFDHGKVEYARIKQNKQQVILDLPIETIPSEHLPSVTVLTVTRNRKLFFDLAIDNWKRIYYPHDKLTWLVVDNSDSVKQGPVELLKGLKDKRIQYYYLAPQETLNPNNPYKLDDERNEKIPSTRSYLLNFAISLIKTDLITIMDEEDYYYDENIISKVMVMKCYEKQCVYSDCLGVFNTRQTSSYLIDKFPNIPLHTVMVTKDFWEKNKFTEDSLNVRDGDSLTMIRLPYFFNVVTINHGMDSSYKMKNRCKFWYKKFNKDKAPISSALNLLKIFPSSFQTALKSVHSTLSALGLNNLSAVKEETEDE